ncbi:hypothetical protein SUGI_0447750 [Cryptomeria japonica]|nr:hypothetical protein SUGI_0447750 [Cryptomeria japonica]
MHVVFVLIWNLQKGWSSLRGKFIRGGSPVSTSSCFPAADLHRAAGFDLFGASVRRLLVDLKIVQISRVL